MKRTLPFILWSLSLLGLFADTVTLNDGRQISGSVESGNTQELHIKVGDQSQTIDIHDVAAIQFQPAASPPQGPAPAPEPPPNHLFLKDGTLVPGRWWSVDATDLHFLVDNQLQHYPRAGVSAVTFGTATLPAPPAPPTPPAPAAPAKPPASAPQPTPAPALSRPSAPPSLARPGAPASRGVSQPEEIGYVYFWNGKVLIPLERRQAAERKNRSAQYFEIPGSQSPVRVSETTRLVFILRLPQGVDPASYSLFQLVTAAGTRRTRSQPGRGGGLMTWPVDIEKNSESGLVTYNLTVRDLPTGEWSFSPSSSNDAYCFGVDAGQ